MDGAAIFELDLALFDARLLDLKLSQRWVQGDKKAKGHSNDRSYSSPGKQPRSSQ